MQPSTLDEKSSKFSSEAYDLKIFITAEEIRKADKQDLHQSILSKSVRLELSLIELTKHYCEDQKLQISDYIKHSVPIVIDSRHNLYHPFLQRILCTYDLLKIPRFLSYQYQNFQGNYYTKTQEDFVSLMEFHVYEWIAKNHPNRADPILKKITGWLESVKPFLLKTPTPLLSFVKIDKEDHKNEVLEIFRKYFSSSDNIKLNTLLSGEPIVGKLVFNGRNSQLLDAFKRLWSSKIFSQEKKRSSKLVLEGWLSNFFSYDNGRSGVKEFTKEHAHQIISKKGNICKKPIPEIVKWSSLK